jgi:hypothetical protein
MKSLENQCSKMVQRNGSWYCGIHDPEKAARKREAAKEKDRRADRLRAAAQARSEALGCGGVHVAFLRGVAAYTGGLVLTAEECDQLINDGGRQ